MSMIGRIYGYIAYAGDTIELELEHVESVTDTQGNHYFFDTERNKWVSCNVKALTDADQITFRVSDDYRC